MTEVIFDLGDKMYTLKTMSHRVPLHYRNLLERIDDVRTNINPLRAISVSNR